MSRTPFDDLEDDAFTSPRTATAAGERAEQVASQVEAAATLMNWEPCASCGGSGVWRGRLKCFRCKGAGMLKLGGNARSDAAKKASVTRQRNLEEKIDAFRAANPAIMAWFSRNTERGNAFALSLWEKFQQYGDLTEGQRAAIERDIAKRDAKIEERKQALDIDVGGLVSVFDYAAKNGAKRLSIRTEHVVFSLAKATGKNPGAVYAKDRVSGEYLGKIIGGKFSRTFACTPAHVDAINEAARDTKAAALHYAEITKKLRVVDGGKSFLAGECSICGAVLTDPVSIEAGIGPVCATKFGW